MGKKKSKKARRENRAMRKTEAAEKAKKTKFRLKLPTYAYERSLTSGEAAELFVVFSSLDLEQPETLVCLEVFEPPRGSGGWENDDTKDADFK